MAQCDGDEGISALLTSELITSRGKTGAAPPRPAQPNKKSNGNPMLAPPHAGRMSIKVEELDGSVPSTRQINSATPQIARQVKKKKRCESLRVRSRRGAFASRRRPAVF